VARRIPIRQRGVPAAKVCCTGRFVSPLYPSVARSGQNCWIYFIRQTGRETQYTDDIKVLGASTFPTLIHRVIDGDASPNFSSGPDRAHANESPSNPVGLQVDTGSDVPLCHLAKLVSVAGHRSTWSCTRTRLMIWQSAVSSQQSAVSSCGLLQLCLLQLDFCRCHSLLLLAYLFCYFSETCGQVRTKIARTLSGVESRHSNPSLIRRPLRLAFVSFCYSFLFLVSVCSIASHVAASACCRSSAGASACDVC
jgi:hypothetical protein